VISEPKFLRRFEQIWAALRRFQVQQGLCATLLVAGFGLAMLAAADYRFEVSRLLRGAGLATSVVFALAALWKWVISPLRWWTKPRTAVEIESRFPQLGQRIRTVVQFAGLSNDAIVSEGVAPSLVNALQEETEAQVDPLPLNRVIPHRRLFAVAFLSLIPVALLTFAALRSPEWRIAIQRALLVERPYTTAEIRPGNLRVDQGDNVPIVVELHGRNRRDVVLQTRPASTHDAVWKATKLDALESGPSNRRESTLEKVKDPVEYRVVAGPATSDAFAIDVRYPLVIKQFDVTLTPPAYTALEKSTVKGGDIQAVEGSTAVFMLAFDATPTEVALEVTDPARKTLKASETTPGPTRMALRPEGDRFVTEMSLIKDLDYKVVAKTADGRVLPKNKHRIDVREDHAPRVSFEEPEEALEVHPIAEVKHRVRSADDFGLTKVGIVFRFNDGEEKTLILRDLSTEAGKKPQTSAALEENLLIETLAATPQDSVTYYAFAEDNLPSGPRRTETDLRYIDIRAFKREYKLADPAAGMGEPDELATLEELIGRQRFNLNRANRLAKHKVTDKSVSDDPLKIAGFEETLLGMLREFTEGIERIAGDTVAPLHRAEEAMLASVEALDHGRNTEAPSAMSEALKNLVAARRELLTLIGKDPAKSDAVRSFDRKQAQKIRKPKSKDEEAELVADELEKLAQEEDFVYATIASGMNGDEKGKAEGKKDGEPDPKEPNEAKNAEKHDPAAPKETPKSETKGTKGSGKAEGEGDPGDAKRMNRREVVEKQERIADEARALEERLKRIEAASELAKARMMKAAEKTEKASGALARGNSKEASEEAKAGAGMLHELARQVKGEIAREVADELAMARDLAEELAQREADLAAMNDEMPTPGGAGEGEGKSGKGRGSKPGKGTGRGGFGGWDALTEAERVERMAEAAKTLESWLKQIDQKGQGKAADAVRDILDQGTVTEIVDRAARMGELRVGGQKSDVSREAKDLAKKLELLAHSLELLHRGIVAPQMAAMVEFDRRVAELTAKLGKLKTDAEITAWHREAAALIRDLEKAGIAGAADLAEALKAGGNLTASGWQWAQGSDGRGAPLAYINALQTVSKHIKDQIQDMILKDLVSARDEATPPKFRELIERYYEVLSKGGAGR